MTQSCSNSDDILIVDDDPGNLKMLTSLLEQEGYGVRTVVPGESALGLAARKIPDLMILNIHMGEMGGRELCRRLKAHTRLADTPVIFICRQPDTTHRIAAFQAGGVDVLSKPFIREEVLARVHAHVTLRGLRIKLEARRGAPREMRPCFKTTRKGYWELELKTNRLCLSSDAYRVIDLEPGAFDGTYEAFLGIFHPEERETADTFLKASMNNGMPFGVDLRLLPGENRERHVHLQCEPLRDDRDRPILFRGMLQDITERLDAEEKIKAAETKYRTFYDNSSEGMYQITPEGSFLNVNPAMARILGYNTPEELMERSVNIRSRLHVDPDRRMEMIDRLRSRGMVTGFETELYRKDNSIATVTCNAHAVYDEGGRILYVEGTVQDISARRQVEEEKKKLEHQLRKAQKLVEIGTFSAGIAHDFNNILSSILGFIELAEQDLGEGGANIRRYLEKMINAGNRARELVRNLMIFSRCTEIHKKKLTMGPLVEDTVNFLQATLSRRIRVRSRINDGGLHAFGDPTQIQQVIINLSTNAAHAMKERGGTLEIRLKALEGTEGDGSGANGTEPSDWLGLTVSDTGTGIAPDKIKRIFDPFFTTKDLWEGSGMGLSIVEGIVKKMSGTIRVESEPGCGTTFQVMLPAYHESTARGTIGLQAKPQSRQKPATREFTKATDNLIVAKGHLQ